MNPYLMVALAAAANLVTVYCLKDAAGMTKPWPTLGVVISILLTQWLLSIAMQGGLNVGLAITGVVVVVMVGSTLMGLLLFGEQVGVWQWAGLALAVAGVTLANVMKGAA